MTGAAYGRRLLNVLFAARWSRLLLLRRRTFLQPGPLALAAQFIPTTPLRRRLPQRRTHVPPSYSMTVLGS